MDDIWADALLPSLGAAFPWLAAILKIPILGSLVEDIINGGADWMIKNSVIAGKQVLLNVLDSASQAKWAPEVALIKQINAAGNTVSDSQQQDFDNALQNLVKNRSGFVNA